jgi:hypothetical protein
MYENLFDVFIFYFVAEEFSGFYLLFFLFDNFVSHLIYCFYIYNLSGIRTDLNENPYYY